MKPLTALIVDDEPLARRRVFRLLDDCDFVGDIREAGDVTEARARIAERRPDILVLDIQMPGETGFDLIEQTQDPAGSVIFVTAFDDQALRAFDAGSIDYVTKPIEPGRFLQALDRARLRVAAERKSDQLEELQETIQALRRALGERRSYVTDLWVRIRGEHVRIATRDVIWIQAERDYVRLHTTDAQPLHHESLASLEQRLDPETFLRVHRSAIVRRQSIARIMPAAFGALVLVLTNGEEVRVGRTYASAIRKQLSASEW